MKATIERAVLLKSLGHVQSVVERRNTIPILSNVLIEAREDGSIRLMATDLDLQVDESVPANVTQPGATTVSAHTLFDIVRKLPEGSQVELTAAEGKMQVVAGRSRFNLSTLPRDDFPVIAEGELPTRFELPAATLRQIIEKTRFAISTEETRYYLMGIFLHVVDDQLRAAATDGHRLARVTVPRPDGAEGMPDVIVPRKAVAELYRLLEELEGTVEVSLSPTKIRFGLGSAVLTSKLIDGTFPDYNRVIPTANDKLLEARPEELLGGRRPRLDHRQREDPRGQDERRPRQGHAFGDQPRERPRDRGAGGRLWLRRARDRLQRPLPARHPRRDRRRHGRSPPRRRRRADAAARERQVERALRADADAGVMICRLWRGWTTPENADAYERIVRGEVIPGIEARKIPGFRHIDLMKRELGDEVEFQTLMWFDSLDAIKAFHGRGLQRQPRTRRRRGRCSSASTSSAAHYEVIDRREQ